MSHPHVLVDGTWVDMLYPAADLKHSTGWYIEEKVEGSPAPSGALRASITLSCPDDMQASWLLPGKSFKIYSHTGGLMSSWITTEPERGDRTITLHAEGIGHKLKDWPALYKPALVELPSFVPNDAVDYAQNFLGAPFGRYGVDLGSTPLVINNSGHVTDLLTLLTRAAIQQGKRLHVDKYGAITYQANPTTPTWMMTPQSDYFGTADDQFLSVLRGFYLNAEAAEFWVTVIGGPTGGTFTLSGNGATTGTIAFNASAATVQTAVRTLGGVFSTATVSALTTGWKVVVDRGGVILTASGAGLTGGTNPGVSVQILAGTGMVKAEDTTASAKFGIRQGSIDLTPLGPIYASAAQTYVDNRFALVGARMGWTTQVELHRGNLFHAPTGLFADPRHVKAGEMLQIPGVVDARSNPTTRGSIQWVMQEVEITEGPEPTATVTPVGFVPRDFDGLLAPPENPATKEAA